MTRNLFAAALTLTGLAACTPIAMSPGAQAMSDEAARAAARSVVTPIVAQQAPGPMGVAMSDCIINNASAGEIGSLARAAANGVTADTVTLVSTILARPETVTCATSAISA